MVIRPWTTPALEPLCCVDDHYANASSDPSYAAYAEAVSTYMLISICSAATSIGISTLIFSCFIYRRSKHNSALLLETRRAYRRSSYGATERKDDSVSQTSRDDSVLLADPVVTPQRLALRMRISLAIAQQTGFGRAHSILLWLFLSDFLAVLTVLLRSALWYSGVFHQFSLDGLPFAPSTTPGALDGTEFVIFEVFCIASSFCVQFFYAAGFLWTIIFAYDTKRLFDERRALVCVYHLVSWLVAAVICTVGLSALYLPDLRHCDMDALHAVPHILATCLPLCVALVTVPVLCSLAMHSCERRLTVASSEFQSSERNELQGIHYQLRLAACVLFICWTPNIAYWLTHLVDYALLESDVAYNDQALQVALKVTWYLTGVTNPLLAALNMLVYSGAARYATAWISGLRKATTTRRYEGFLGSAAPSFSETLVSGHSEFSLARRSAQPRRVVHDLDEHLADSQ